MHSIVDTVNYIDNLKENSEELKRIKTKRSEELDTDKPKI